MLGPIEVFLADESSCPFLYGMAEWCSAKFAPRVWEAKASVDGKEIDLVKVSANGALGAPLLW